MARTAAQMSFGLRTRLVLGGDDLGGARVWRSRQCWGATCRCLDVRSELSPVLGCSIGALAGFTVSLFLSLFYFPGMEINCRENTSVKYFTGFWGMIYSQRKSFSVWLNFLGQPKHAQWCKIFSGNYLLPKQTHPKRKKRRAWEFRSSSDKTLKLQRIEWIWAKNTMFFLSSFKETMRVIVGR